MSRHPAALLDRAHVLGQHRELIEQFTERMAQHHRQFRVVVREHGKYAGRALAVPSGTTIPNLRNTPRTRLMVRYVAP
jgi:hypothetical protein